MLERPATGSSKEQQDPRICDPGSGSQETSQTGNAHGRAVENLVSRARPRVAQLLSRATVPRPSSSVVVCTIFGFVQNAPTPKNWVARGSRRPQSTRRSCEGYPIVPNLARPGPGDVLTAVDSFGEDLTLHLYAAQTAFMRSWQTFVCKTPHNGASGGKDAALVRASAASSRPRWRVCPAT